MWVSYAFAAVEPLRDIFTRWILHFSEDWSLAKAAADDFVEICRRRCFGFVINMFTTTNSLAEVFARDLSPVLDYGELYFGPPVSVTIVRRCPDERKKNRLTCSHMLCVRIKYEQGTRCRSVR